MYSVLSHAATPLVVRSAGGPSKAMIALGIFSDMDDKVLRQIDNCEKTRWSAAGKGDKLSSLHFSYFSIYEVPTDDLRDATIAEWVARDCMKRCPLLLHIASIAFKMNVQDTIFKADSADFFNALTAVFRDRVLCYMQQDHGLVEGNENALAMQVKDLSEAVYDELLQQGVLFEPTVWHSTKRSGHTVLRFACRRMCPVITHFMVLVSSSATFSKTYDMSKFAELFIAFINFALSFKPEADRNHIMGDAVIVSGNSIRHLLFDHMHWNGGSLEKAFNYLLSWFMYRRKLLSPSTTLKLLSTHYSTVVKMRMGYDTSAFLMFLALQLGDLSAIRAFAASMAGSGENVYNATSGNFSARNTTFGNFSAHNATWSTSEPLNVSNGQRIFPFANQTISMRNRTYTPPILREDLNSSWSKSNTTFGNATNNTGFGRGTEFAPQAEDPLPTSGSANYRQDLIIPPPVADHVEEGGHTSSGQADHQKDLTIPPPVTEHDYQYYGVYDFSQMVRQGILDMVSSGNPFFSIPPFVVVMTVNPQDLEANFTIVDMPQQNATKQITAGNNTTDVASNVYLTLASGLMFFSTSLLLT